MEDPSDGISALWRRLDMPGHEAVRIYEGDDGWILDGASVFSYKGKPCRLEYLIECDPDWKTSIVTVDGFVGHEVVAIEIESENGVWYVNGEEVGDVERAIDIDLNFSPVTNLLPIRRSNLAVGDEAAVRAAWLRFPSFKLETLEQIYTRTGESIYTYRSSTGLEKAITVDEFGLVAEYADFWVREVEE